MNAGLAQGFVRFDTLAHRILLIMHEFGPQTNSWLTDTIKEEGVFDPRGVSANLKRLHAAHFIHKVGRYRPEFGRSSAVFDVRKWQPEAFKSATKKVSHNERSRKYRARKAVNANSVFGFRGTIEVVPKPQMGRPFKGVVDEVS